MNRKSTKSEYTGTLSRRLGRRYVLSLLAVTLAVLALLTGSVMFLSTFNFWRFVPPLYWLVNFCERYVVLVSVASILAGWTVCTAWFSGRLLRNLDRLVDAAEEMSRPDGGPVVLPEDLAAAQDHLNLARERAVRNQQAAREAEQRKNDLVVYLAHDLKTPLTSVIGYLTLLRDERDLSPELRERYTGIALEKAERLEDLVNEFFDVTRFSLTHLELEKRPADLVRMLEQVSSEFQPQLSERGLRCVLNLPAKLPYTGDPDKLARVFDNLLRNACCYSYPDTAILVSGRQEEREIVLTFTNAGPTIPKEKLERIFEQFFRLDSSRASRTGGAGLGLAIAREIVHLHGGNIHAWSENEKAVFTVTLPLD